MAEAPFSLPAHRTGRAVFPHPALGQELTPSPTGSFDALYDKVYRRDILAFASAHGRSHNGASGIDGQTFADIEAYGVARGWTNWPKT